MRWALGLVWLGVPGCFLGYDSRWGQQKQAQQHVAAHGDSRAVSTSNRPAMEVRVAPRAFAGRLYRYAGLRGGPA